MELVNLHSGEPWFSTPTSIGSVARSVLIAEGAVQSVQKRVHGEGRINRIGFDRLVH